jgi:FecR-like protein
LTSYRLALALPLLVVWVSSAWAQVPQTPAQQAPAATAPADQQPDEPIGNVATLTGTATVTRNNATTPLKLKDDIYLNDVVATAATSSLGITFNDATTFTLKANAQVTIDNYVYEDGAKNNSGIFDIAKGTVAFAAAAVAKTGNMQITTPTSALGIRGTTGLVEVPEGGAAATAANNIKLYPDADGRVGQIEVNDRQGRRLGALTQGASGFAVRGGPGGARVAAVPLTISPQQAQRDQGFVRQLHATQSVGRQIVSQQREFRRANPQYRNPARPQQPGQNRPGQPGTTPNRPGQPGTPNNRPGQPGAPNRQGQQQTPGNPQQPAGAGRQGQQQAPGTPQQAPARQGQSPAGTAPSGTAQPNTLPRTGAPSAPGTPATGAPTSPGTPGVVGPRTGAAPVTPPALARPGAQRPKLPGLPKGKPPPPPKKKR